MTALPGGWQASALGSVLTVRYGKALPGPERLAKGPYPLVGSAGRMQAYSSVALASRPALVIGRKGNAGAVTLEERGCWPTDTTYYVEIPEDVFDRRFLLRQLQAADLRSLDSSTAVPSLRRHDLERHVLVIPPLEEQRRIVDILEDHLSRLDSAARSLDQARGRAECLLRSVLQHGLRGTLFDSFDPFGSGEELIPHGAVMHVGSFSAEERSWAVPPSWCWTRIGRAFHVHIGTTPARHDASQWTGELPWVSSGEVAFARIKHTREGIARPENPRRIHPPGTVLLAMIGEGKTRGQAAILDVEAAHNQNCASIRVDGTEVLPEYVYYFLQERYLITRRAASGGNQPALNKRIIESIPIPIPPRGVQKRLVESFESYDEALKRLAMEAHHAKAKGARLRKALLTAAFSGYLTNRTDGLEGLRPLEHEPERTLRG